VEADRLAALRQHYVNEGLHTAELHPDWAVQFGTWLAEAVEAGLAEPNAMVLATADAVGQPSARHVLLKAYDSRGFVFYTNYTSRKGREVEANPRASLVFPWFPIGRQVVVVGSAHRITREETEAYFASRPRESQIGAWASEHQSAVVASRRALDDHYREVADRFADAAEIPAPPFWGGVRVVPDTVEFWQGRAARMHDRLRYRRDGDSWRIERLSP
jgi:pyridoxamine 5'-phosphate oxidase